MPDWWLFTKGESRNPNVSPASETIEKTVIKPFGLVAEINRGRSRAITATAANVAAAVGTFRTAPAVVVVDCMCGGEGGVGLPFISRYILRVIPVNRYRPKHEKRYVDTVP